MHIFSWKQCWHCCLGATGSGAVLFPWWRPQPSQLGCFFTHLLCSPTISAVCGLWICIYLKNTLLCPCRCFQGGGGQACVQSAPFTQMLALLFSCSLREPYPQTFLLNVPSGESIAPPKEQPTGNVSWASVGGGGWSGALGLPRGCVWTDSAISLRWHCRLCRSYKGCFHGNLFLIVKVIGVNDLSSWKLQRRKYCSCAIR